MNSLNFKPDIYITRNFFTCFLLVLLKKKTILELHHDLDNESRIVKFLVKKFNFLNSKNLLKLIAITSYVKLNYVSKYSVRENKIAVLPSGSSISERFKFKIRKKNFNIGYFGSLYESRGQKLLLDLAKIDKKNKYFIYGNTKQIKNLISKKKIKNLIINDYIPYKEVPKILSNMDLLLMPYTSKITAAGNFGDITKFTSPLKLFDYLSVGKVILCSDYPVLKEILKKNINVIFLKNYKNVYAWKLEIEKLFYQKEKTFIISKNNYKYAKKFSLIKRADKILKLINE
ncbi:glycosyltransferase [Candidatus Pelagibacter communis]|uniref:glycosyltransferase n=1 Tax=Pelagibacter ubique TaxID=198252 RepID=UPI0015CF76C4|nr:glycosyltransferase [Candidatus Pelagibacter ubique]